MRFKLRIFVVLFSLLLSWMFLKDTFNWYFFMSDGEKSKISLNVEEIKDLSEAEKNNITFLKKMRKKVINMGLDLQGGLYLVLSLKDDALKTYLADKYKKELLLGKYKEKKISNVKLLAEIDKMIKDNWKKEKERALDSAYSKIGNRVDEFGISEPIIQKGSDQRIYVSLAGIKDPQAAQDIVSRAGRLTFQIYDVATQSRFTKKYGSSNPEFFVNFGTKNNREWRIANDTVIPKDFNVGNDAKLYYVWEKDNFGIPKKKGGIFLKKEVLLEGDRIVTARPYMGQYGNEVKVSFILDSIGAKRFSKVTGEHKGDYMAIVLDGKVQSYPRIQNKIPGGSGVITGKFSIDEAKNLSAILTAGSFNVGLRIEEKRQVGPSLGRDSVIAGTRAIIIGFALIFIFMLIYYRYAGIIANIALLFNMVLVLAIMTQLGATLTLPGIAGLILTLGMSVDANVIVFERIKEEMRGGRVQVRAAVEKGFGRAFRTVFDANLTTLLASLILMQIGSGAVKGFAVTLFIGILSSMYTALFVSRLLIDGSISVFKMKKIV